MRPRWPAPLMPLSALKLSPQKRPIRLSNFTEGFGFVDSPPPTLALTNQGRLGSIRFRSKPSFSSLPSKVW